MFLRFYDGSLNLVGINEDFKSFIWREKPQSPGSFELIMPATPENRKLAETGSFVWYRGAADAGMIEKKVQDDELQQLTISGRFATALLEQRVVYGDMWDVWQDGIQADAMAYALLGEAYQLPLVTAASARLSGHPVTLSAARAMFGKSTTQSGVIVAGVDFQDATLAQIAKAICTRYKIGYRLRADISNRMFVFEFYEFNDHTQRERVVFTDMDGEIVSTRRTETLLTMATEAVIMRPTTGSGSTVSYTEHPDYTYPQYQFENDIYTIPGLWSQPRAYWMTSVGGLTSPHQFQRTYQDTKDTQTYMSIHADYFEYEISDAMTTYKAGVDFKVGDTVGLKLYRWGVTQSAQVTEIQHVYDKDGQKKVITLGEATTTTMEGASA